MCSNSPSSEPTAVHHLRREHLPAVASPLRQSILRELAREPLSATELRERLEDAPTNLHYHVDRLREAGLIREVGRQQKRGAVERYYRAVARTYTLGPELTVAATADRDLTEPLLEAVRGLVDSTYDALAAVLAGPMAAATDRDLDEPPLDAVRGLMESTYDALAAILARGALETRSSDGLPVVTGCAIRTSRRSAKRLERRLARWVDECRDAEEEDGDVEMRLLALQFDGPESDAA